MSFVGCFITYDGHCTVWSKTSGSLLLQKPNRRVSFAGNSDMENQPFGVTRPHNHRVDAERWVFNSVWNKIDHSTTAIRQPCFRSRLNGWILNVTLKVALSACSPTSLIFGSFGNLLDQWISVIYPCHFDAKFFINILQIHETQQLTISTLHVIPRIECELLRDAAPLKIDLPTNNYPMVDGKLFATVTMWLYFGVVQNTLAMN